MLQEISPGVYVEDSFEGGNVGAITADGLAVLVDTPMLPPDARRWRDCVASLAPNGIYAIVNTDYHPEHMLGNAVFAPVRTFGHESSARAIAKYNAVGIEAVAAVWRARDPALADELSHTQLLLPELQVDDRAIVYLGSRRIVIYHMAGHTPASLGVFLPEEGILFAGENVTVDAEPVMVQADTPAWLATLQRIKTMPVTRIVPSEGPVCGREALDPLIAHITDLREAALDMFRHGASRRETVEKVEVPDRFGLTEEQVTRYRRRRRENLERIYTEIRLAERKK